MGYGLLRRLLLLAGISPNTTIICKWARENVVVLIAFVTDVKEIVETMKTLQGVCLIDNWKLSDAYGVTNNLNIIKEYNDWYNQLPKARRFTPARYYLGERIDALKDQPFKDNTSMKKAILKASALRRNADIEC